MKCKICAADFEPRSSYHFCCSKVCSQINQKRLEKAWQERNPDYWESSGHGPLDLVCDCCGNGFQSIVPHAKYCSPECRHKVVYARRLSEGKIHYERKPKVSKTCPICSSEFLAHPNRIYCSKECGYASRPKPEPKSPELRSCPECSTEFIPVNRQKYCSEKCQARVSNRNYKIKHPAKKGCVGKTDTLQKLDKRIRKDRIRKNTPKWVNRQELLDMFLNRPAGFEVDHIIPINHDLVSGLNVPWNLQYLPAEDNNYKSNQFDGTYENESWKINPASVLGQTQQNQ